MACRGRRLLISHHQGPEGLMTSLAYRPTTAASLEHRSVRLSRRPVTAPAAPPPPPLVACVARILRVCIAAIRLAEGTPAPKVSLVNHSYLREADACKEALGASAV